MATEEVAIDFVYFTFLDEFGVTPMELDKMDCIQVDTMLYILNEKRKEHNRLNKINKRIR